MSTLVILNYYKTTQNLVNILYETQLITSRNSFPRFTKISTCAHFMLFKT